MMIFDAITQLHRQRNFSFETFGPPNGVKGVIDHIRKEVVEVADPTLQPHERLEEWIDIMILASDGAMRDGYTPEEVVIAWRDKQIKNEKRKWPNWRTADPDKAIEHIREIS